ncbi:MAG: phosphate signaling complex protein PhoU [Clostridia bacterium]|nr:phosphate signaling complex protein PhoU [Clostridia bacterium]
MRNRFDQQLEHLNNELITMGTLCERAISMAIKGLLEQDETLRAGVFSVGGEVSQKERDIERQCMTLLLQQQPVAKDLRLISSALKMIYDMERIGILACDIAEISKFIRYADFDKDLHLKTMAEEAIKMVSDSIRSFVDRDLSLADAVVAYDDVVDDLFTQIKNELLTVIIARHDRNETCIDLLMIAKYLEKIGDHAVNVAGWVRYSITGKHGEE